MLRLTKNDVGGLFVTRNGEIARVVQVTENPSFPFQGVVSGALFNRTSWTENGTFFEHSEDMHDLIRRITQEDADVLTVAQHFHDL